MSMTLSERAYYAIRDLIVRIELAPGDVIREDVLQDRLGLRENDAARFGVVLGNTFKKANKADFSRLSYYDLDNNAFKWFR